MHDRESLKEFIENVKLKRAFIGGYKKKDVQMKFEVYHEMVENYIDQQKREFDEKVEALTADYEQKLKASDFLLVELNKNISELTEENEAMVLQQVKMKEAYKEYCKKLLQQYSSSLRSLSMEFSHVLENVTSLQEEIVNKDISAGLDHALEMRKIEEL